MNPISIILLLSLLMKTDTSSYPVNHTDQPISISGQGDDPGWATATILTDFINPWSPDPVPPTQFQALWDDQYFYFLYQVEDRNIIAPGDPNDKRGVLPSDRVEIFFKANGEMDPYYCLEMDPRGRVLDYIARFYRQVDFDWEWPEDALVVKASQTENQYVVEGRITLKSLREMGILSGSQMEAGLFRGDYFPVKGKENQVHWISWIQPESQKPDFHLPSAFGFLNLIR
ncbi:MAG: carbohydrate-binding family 9-like protein [Saprospiraceae bacterium]|nr:carbohydrate-binding family 9-like protein [Saprospiraceae bacterium]